MNPARLEAVIHDAQEVVDMLKEIARKLRVKAAVESVPDAGTVRQPWRPILARVANEAGFTVAELLKGRRQDAVDARLEAYIALREAGYSYPEIGRFVGRDHSTVMHALKGAK